MPLTLFYYPSFGRSFKNLDATQRRIVKRILKALLVYYTYNCQLSMAQEIEPRFFHKQLRKPYYEAGVESKIRVLIEREKSKCFAILAGNHEQIKRFLASH
ncbi:MAG: hypothetical protein ACUZ8O_00555 [Candidatus Anammoxibacter sp.]